VIDWFSQVEKKQKPVYVPPFTEKYPLASGEVYFELPIVRDAFSTVNKQLTGPRPSCIDIQLMRENHLFQNSEREKCGSRITAL
jgi:hypothetical protein